MASSLPLASLLFSVRRGLRRRSWKSVALAMSYMYALKKPCVRHHKACQLLGHAKLQHQGAGTSGAHAHVPTSFQVAMHGAASVEPCKAGTRGAAWPSG